MPTRPVQSAITPAELKLRALLLRYIAQQPHGDVIRHIHERHVNAFAAMAAHSRPKVRDTEVTARRPVVEDGPPLTDTELRVLVLLPTDFDTAGIAQELGLTVGQVQRATKSVYVSLDVSTRHGAVASAIRLGMLRWDGASWAPGRPQERPGPSGAGDSAPEGATEAPEALQAIPGAA